MLLLLLLLLSFFLVLLLLYFKFICELLSSLLIDCLQMFSLLHFVLLVLARSCIFYCFCLGLCFVFVCMRLL